MSASQTLTFDNGKVKPSPPLAFYSYAAQEKYKPRRFLSPMAGPGAAAPLHKRNKSNFIPLNVKSITGSKLPDNAYVPQTYLSPG